MSHGRKQIRDAVKSILDGGQGWKTVLPTRIEPGRQIWPYLLVFSDGEPGIHNSIQQGNIVERDLSLNIIAMLRVGAKRANVEDDIDEISEEIETLMTNANLRAKLTGKNLILHLQSNQFTVMVDEEDKVSHAEIVMAWTVKYFTAEGVPSVLL